MIKGSVLEIDVTVDETESSDGVPEFASLTDALYYQPFDAHTVKLICEVPILEGINIQGADGKKREVILDVNSFDIRFANHSATNTAGLTVGNNTEFMVKDGPNAAEQDQGQKTITDMKNSTLIVLEGGEFHNHGALSIKGEFELLGTLFNYGRYNDIIQASDPDKGTVTYHKGIQLTWKDDVRNPEVVPGLLSMGVYLEKYDLLN